MGAQGRRSTCAPRPPSPHTRFSEPPRQPVQQLRIRGVLAEEAEVLGGIDETGSEVTLPDSVDGYAAGERILRRSEPAGEVEPAAPTGFDQRWIVAAQNGQKVSRHGLAEIL